MAGSSCEGGTAIHLTPQGSVFQHNLVSGSQFSRLCTRIHQSDLVGISTLQRLIIDHVHFMSLSYDAC